MNARASWFAALLLLFAVPPAAAELRPRIVNGFPTDAYPAVGLVALYADAAQTELTGLCSGTLVGCRTVLTAAHCVCPDGADTYESCQEAGVDDLRAIAVFLPHVGVLRVDNVEVHPDFEFGSGQDVAMLHLAMEADAVPPLPLAMLFPRAGDAGQVVGYGTTGGGIRSVDDTGIKREGSIVFGSCPADVPAEANVCWHFSGKGANTCSGDSGGAVIQIGPSGPRLAGVVSGGSTADCQPPDDAFATAIAAVKDWIMARAGGDVGFLCQRYGRLGDGATTATTYLVALSAASASVQRMVDVPPNTAELRVTFNGETGSRSGFSATDNDFDLFVAPSAFASAGQWTCTDERLENWGACRIERPSPGPWQVELRRVEGSGQAQITVTLLPTANACAGDCSGDGQVTVDEIVTAVRILLGSDTANSCAAADIDHDGEVTVDEIVTAVNVALRGCS